MQIKILKDQKVNEHVWIRKGTIVEARIFATLPFQFNAPYQIIDGPQSGVIVPRENCIEVKDDEKKVSQAEWQVMENYYLAKLKNEKEQKEKAQQLARELTEQIKLKNKEISKLEFFLNALRQTVIFFSFNNNKELEYHQKNG